MLGLTIQCAQCHTHKYDPLTHTEYYRMFAFLNNCHEAQITVYTPRAAGRMAGDRGDDSPHRRSASGRQSRLARADGGVGSERSRRSAGVDRRSAQADDSSGGQKHYVLDDGSILAAGYAPTMHTTEFTVDVEAAEDHGRAAGTAERSEPAARRPGPVDLRHLCADRIPGRGRAARSVPKSERV